MPDVRSPDLSTTRPVARAAAAAPDRAAPPAASRTPLAERVAAWVAALVAGVLAHARWLWAMVQRGRRLWVVKMLGTMGGIYLFFMGYFWVLRHPQAPVLTMPLLAPDRWVDFNPQALWVYVSLWLYVSLGPALLASWRELRWVAGAMTLMSGVGLAIFAFWPTAVPAFAIDLARHPEMAMLKGIDATANSCPSMHVAFSVFSAVWLDWLLRLTQAPRGWRPFNVLWCLAILWSTMATRQHVLLDVLAGAALGGVIGWVALRLMLRRAPRA